MIQDGLALNQTVIYQPDRSTISRLKLIIIIICLNDYLFKIKINICESRSFDEINPTLWLIICFS